MALLALTLTPSSSVSLGNLNLPLTSPTFCPCTSKLKRYRRPKSKSRTCRAEFSGDVPFVAAIGACVLSSFLLPKAADGGSKSRDSDDEESGISTKDTRFTVMGIISFIPYFNWLSWVFAWLDTKERRYAIYSLVYLAPYLRSNMSLSPEDSWLPIASIFIGIVHVQLEASISNGDLQGVQLFTEASNFLSSVTKKSEFEMEEGHFGEVTKQGYKKLPHGEEEGGGEEEEEEEEEEKSKDENPKWAVPSEHHQHSKGDWDDDDMRNVR
ncbi:hypothetical protein K2173_021476 [Erythroxylum novogranatense]|uniref:Uncharacterized protein n=1 Tax=Erythroxylum novogranatense TaxID=1862640 RepID=A0AAV8TQ34_9ROSI|nr:hypothetical protein K2173_021476 [Erythroxylum novogranatense]